MSGRHDQPLPARRFRQDAMRQDRHVDLIERWAVFRNTKRGKNRQIREGEDRGVPLHKDAVAMLASLPHRDGRVFRTEKGLPSSKRGGGGGHIKTAWRANLKRAGMEDLYPHDLRHTFSTWLTMAGVHAQVRGEVMGHSSSSMGRRYAHVVRPAPVEAVDSLKYNSGSANSVESHPRVSESMQIYQ